MSTTTHIRGKEVAVGTILTTTDQRGTRRVRVVSTPDPGHGHWRKFLVENVDTGRKTEISRRTLREKWTVDAPLERTNGSADSRNTISPRRAQPLKSERQVTLLRIVKGAFSDFQKRQQHFYIGGGMSTTHVVTKTIADIEALHLFWPRELIRRKPLGGTTYVLEDTVMRRVQDRIRDTLNELEAKGHLEKIGNTDERRWRPTYAKEA